ncbi:MAG: hypothetical protein ED556_01230 [Winogradskyella sp.]|nr:MAG: hypothetical protein ED556_01230 [Winogradskyella sp.]
MSGAINWMFQVTITLILFFLSSILIKKTFSKGITIKLIALVTPFVVLYGYGIISSMQPLNMKLRVVPVLIAPILGLTFSFLSNYNLKNFIIYGLFSSIIGYLFMPNWIEYVTDSENPINKEFPKLSILDIDDKPFKFPKNKTIIMDLWSSNCGVCIKKFPEFENLKNKYKENEKIEFYSLNLPLKKDSLKNVKRIVRNYQFTSLFAQNIDAWKKLNNSTVPKILIINASNKIVYKGNLNDKWYLLYNDINKLIKKNTKN